MVNINQISNEQLITWFSNKTINPLSKRKIKQDGPIFKKIQKLYDERIKTIPVSSPKGKKLFNDYENFRRNKIDPILLLDLPLNDMEEKDLFKFEYKWDPYTGLRSKQKDPNGALYFDPNVLINYFYTNRLNNLWVDEYFDGNDYIQGHYGDALGKYPNFEIKGRGPHPEWYLFRLPIIDCYLEKDHSLQMVTMGPILTDKEIKKIYTLSKRYKKFYKETFGVKRPNIVKMKQIYDKAVNPNLEYNNLEGFTQSEINMVKFDLNSTAVKNLIVFK